LRPDALALLPGQAAPLRSPVRRRTGEGAGDVDRGLDVLPGPEHYRLAGRSRHGRRRRIRSSNSPRGQPGAVLRAL